MPFLKPIKVLITTILLLTFNTFLFGQKLVPKKKALKPDHTITSNITKTAHQLYISLPENYSKRDRISYPVLYVLDGQYSFYSILETKDALDVKKSIEEIIIGRHKLLN